MSAFSGAEAGAWAPLQKAARRLVPSYEMQVDLVAVSRVGSCSTRADWAAGTLTNVGVNDRGEVRLAPGGAGLTLLDTTGGSPTLEFEVFNDTSGASHEYTIDLWVDPAYVGGLPFTLGTLRVTLARFGVGSRQFLGEYHVSVSTYDEQWRKVPLGDPVILTAADVPHPGLDITIDFANRGREFVVDPGLMRTRTGPGLDASGNRRDIDPVDGLSQLSMVRALSIGISAVGTSVLGAALATVSSLPAFDPTTFWRTKNVGGFYTRHQGPYYPSASPPLEPSTDRNLDGYLVTGAVPGYGARSCASGMWGIARRVTQSGDNAQRVRTWYQPLCAVRARTVQPSGSIVVVLDMTSVPVYEVEFRADDWVRRGTSITYALRGRNDAGDAWTSLGAVADGDTVAPWRFYEVTATLAATVVTGGAALVSPVLQAVQLVERVRYRTEGLTGAIDADVSVDPVTGQSAIGELALSLLRGGRDDFRDLATSLASQVSPSRLEAQVFGVCTSTGARRFLESYRLESRTPHRDREELTFTSGLDRLQVRIPPQVETYALPPAGGTFPTISAITGGGTSRTVTLTGPGASWAEGQLTGYRLRIVTGAASGIDCPITATPATNQVTITVPAAGDLPATGDAVEIHSDVYRRQDVIYTAQDPAVVFEDVLTARARVPRRLIGALPATGRLTSPGGTVLTTSGRLKASGGSDDGVTALSVLQALATLLGGAVVWQRGRIAFVDLFSARDSAVVWDERDYVQLDTPTGLDRRMPSVSCKFGPDPATDAFAGEVIANDLDVLYAAGRANLFDVTAVDEAIARWCTTQPLAEAVVRRLRDAFAAGVPVWNVQLAHQCPWVDLGDVVTIMTDQFTARRFRFSPDGTADIGDAIAGRTATVGVVIGRNLAADKFLVLARSTTPAPNGSVGGGENDGPLAGIPVPLLTLTATRGGIEIASTPPTSAYFARMEYDVRTRATTGPGAWSSATRLVGSKEGLDFLALVPEIDTDVEITPSTVSTGGTVRTGTAATIALDAFGGGTMGPRFTSCTVGSPAPGDGPEDLTLTWTVLDAPTGATYDLQVLFDGVTQTISGATSGIVLRTDVWGSSGTSHATPYTTGGLLSMISAGGAVLAQQKIPVVTYYSGDLT
jgi:hypothetical protein